MRVESDYYAEPDEIRERCLNCEYPSELCMGELNCLAKNRLRKIALKEAILYGIAKGETQAQIARELYINNQYVSHILKEAKS